MGPSLTAIIPQISSKLLYMKNLLLVLVALCSLLSALAQNKSNLEEIKVDGFYQCSLTEFLHRIEKEKEINIEFDPEKFNRIEVNHRYFDRTLNDVLNQISEKHGLKYLVDNSGIIQFVTGGVIDPNAYEKYDGPPSKSNFTVSGKISDSNSGESLPFVTVYVKGTQIGSISNVDGFFSVLNVPSDTSTLIFSYIGYRNLELLLNPKMSVSGMKVEMYSGATELDEVVVTGDRESVMQVNEQISTIKLTPAKLNKLPSLGERDIFRAFQLMPGVSAANENSSGLYVRGGTPDQSLVTYDGFTVYHVDHLFGFFSAFNSNAIKDVNLYKGGFEPKFGGRVASVAEITSKDGNQNHFNAGGEISMLSYNAYVEAPIGSKVTTMFAARKSYKGPIYNKLFDVFGPEDPEPPNQNPNRPNFTNTSSTVASFFYDMNGKVTYRPTSKDVLSVSIYNGKDNLDNSVEIPSFAGNFGNIAANTNDLTEWGNTGGSLKWGRQWSDKFYSNILLSNSRYFSNRDRSVERTVTPNDGEARTINAGLIEKNRIRDASFKADFEYKISNKNSIEFGTHLTKNEINYSYSQNDTISIIDRYDNANTLAFYLQNERWMFNQKLKMIRGARFMHYSITGKTYIEPRLAINYYLSDKVTLKASAGRYNQFAKRVIREDVLQGSRDFWVMADGDKLPVLSSDQLILGASYEKNGFVFDVEGYYKRLKGLSEYSLRFTPEQGGLTYEDNFFQGTGSTLGLDFLVQKSHGNYTGWLAYTLSDTDYNFPDFQEGDFPAAQDVTHEFNFVNMYKLGAWDFSLTWIYATGRPYTEPTGGYTVSLLDGTEQDYVSVSGKNAVRFPDYHRLDASITYNWKSKSGGLWSLSTSFFNLYNRTNTWYKEYQIEEDELIETDINFLGFTPNLTLSFKLR